jgi:hypothetical protein
MTPEAAPPKKHNAVLRDATKKVANQGAVVPLYWNPRALLRISEGASTLQPMPGLSREASDIQKDMTIIVTTAPTAANPNPEMSTTVFTLWVMQGNVVGQWRRGKGAQCRTEAESRRPLHWPG